MLFVKLILSEYRVFLGRLHRGYYLEDRPTAMRPESIAIGYFSEVLVAQGNVSSRGGDKSSKLQSIRSRSAFGVRVIFFLSSLLLKVMSIDGAFRRDCPIRAKA